MRRTTPLSIRLPHPRLNRCHTKILQVLSLIADPNEASMVTTCRGQLWRARSSFSGPPDRRRLLSEIDVPTPLSVAGAAGAEKMENMLGEKIPWEVLPCVGFPLPKSFDVSSSLGGLGHLQLSRYPPPLYEADRMYCTSGLLGVS